VTITVGTPTSITDDVASAESTALGTVSGAFADTHADDGVAETITEEESGGNPESRTSQLDHTWTVSVTGGEVVTVLVDAAASVSADGDRFTFAYSTDGITFNDMFIVDSSTNGYQSYVLPPSIQGDLLIRVTDDDRGPGNRSLDTLSVDHLYVRSETPGPGSAPSAPDGVAAVAGGSTAIEVTWIDRSTTEAGFEIERRLVGTPTWTIVGTSQPDTGSLVDIGLEAATEYEYRVRAYGAGGVSAWSTPASATTLANSSITLTATPYKVKGVQHVDLAWSDTGAGSYDVYRDGDVIATPTTPTYTDDIGVKGGGTYTYRVCEAGTATCSIGVDVGF
jgi:hypothetical protein